MRHRHQRAYRQTCADRDHVLSIPAELHRPSWHWQPSKWLRPLAARPSPRAVPRRARSLHGPAQGQACPVDHRQSAECRQFGQARHWHRSVLPPGRRDHNKPAPARCRPSVGQRAANQRHLPTQSSRRQRRWFRFESSAHGSPYQIQSRSAPPKPLCHRRSGTHQTMYRQRRP